VVIACLYNWNLDLAIRNGLGYGQRFGNGITTQYLYIMMNQIPKHGPAISLCNIPLEFCFFFLFQNAIRAEFSPSR